MMLRRAAATLVACAALFTGLSFTPAAAEELPACATTPYRSEVARYENPGRWIYTYQIVWCVEDGVIKWRKPIITNEVLDPRCRWVGNMEEWEKPVPDTKDWHVFNMSMFSCDNGDGGTYGETPWVIVSVSPDGSSSVIDGGVAPAD